MDGVHVALDLIDRGPQLAVEARISAPTASGLRLELLPSDLTTALGRAVGGQDLLVGDPTFDRAFMVKTDDLGLARAWLTERVRRLLLTTRGYRFVLAEGRVLAVGYHGSADV